MAGTVSVACKLPCGYIMEVYGMEDVSEPVMGGGWKTVKRAVKTGRSIKLNGCAFKTNKPFPHEIRNGVGLTFGVDADLFAAWLEQHKDDDLVKKNIIFAAPRTIDVDAKAKEMIDEKSGMEPIDTAKLPPEFRKKIETAPAG